MMNMMKRLAALLLALLLLLPGLCTAEDTEVEEEPEPAAEDETVTEKDGWHFNAKGFLTGENPGDEYLLEDEEKGVWQYASRDLSVKVTRFREKTKKKKHIVMRLKRYSNSLSTILIMHVNCISLRIAYMVLTFRVLQSR